MQTIAWSQSNYIHSLDNQRNQAVRSAPIVDRHPNVMTFYNNSTMFGSSFVKLLSYAKQLSRALMGADSNGRSTPILSKWPELEGLLSYC
jgi:hypothetical protein